MYEWRPALQIITKSTFLFTQLILILKFMSSGYVNKIEVNTNLSIFPSFSAALHTCMYDMICSLYASYELTTRVALGWNNYPIQSFLIHHLPLDKSPWLRHILISISMPLFEDIPEHQLAPCLRINLSFNLHSHRFTYHFPSLLLLKDLQTLAYDYQDSLQDSFIFSKLIILVKVMGAPESIPGAQGTRLGHTLNGTPGHHRAPCMHARTHAHTHSH